MAYQVVSLRIPKKDLGSRPKIDLKEATRWSCEGVKARIWDYQPRHEPCDIGEMRDVKMTSTGGPEAIQEELLEVSEEGHRSPAEYLCMA